MKIELTTTKRELMALRRSRQWKRAATRPLFFLVSPWIAGVRATDALNHAKRLSQNGNKALINFLGEHYQDPVLVEHAVHEYRHLLQNLGRQKSQNPNFAASISIKPSQFGFDLETKNPSDSQRICFSNMKKIVSQAAGNGIGIEVDMEHAAYTDWTIGFYKALLPEFFLKLPNFRVCLQANLKRTPQDLQNLLRTAPAGTKIGIRLVKGIYPENQNPNAFHAEEEVTRHFESLINAVFKKAAQIDLAIGTHQPDIIQMADILSAGAGTGYELQMLKGIGEEIKREREQKFKPYTEYVPYGKDAIPYGFRRAQKMLKWTIGGAIDSIKNRKPN